MRNGQKHQRQVSSRTTAIPVCREAAPGEPTWDGGPRVPTVSSAAACGYRNILA